MKIFSRILLLFLSGAPFIACPVLLAVFAPASFAAGAALTALGLAGLLAMIVTNAALYARAGRAVLAHPVREYMDRLTAERERIRADVRAARRRVLRTVALCRLYACAMLLFAFILLIGFSLLAGLFLPDCDGSAAVVAIVSILVWALFALPAALVLLPPLAQPPEKKVERLSFLDRGEFPLLYALAGDAARAVGYTGPFLLVRELQDESVFSASEEDGIVRIGVPPVALCLMTREEVYAVLLHEFAHIAHRDAGTSALIARTQAQFSAPQTWKWAAMLFSYPDQILTERGDEYLRYASPLLEAEADDAVKTCGYAQAFTDATFKSLYLADLFRFPCRTLDYELYESETPPDDCYERRVAYAQRRIPEERERLRPVFLRTLPSRNDTHPTPGMRMQALGTTDFDISRREGAGAFRDEVQRYVASCSALMKNKELYDWDAARKKHYLGRNRDIAAFERAYTAGEADEALWEQAMYAYAVTDPARMKELVKEAACRSDLKTSAPLLRAVWLCAEDDRRGIDELYPILRRDPLKLDSLGDIFWTTVFRTGDEALVESLRAEQAEWVQEARDLLLTLMKVKKKRPAPVPCDLPEARLSAMRAVFARIRTDAMQGAFIARIPSPKLRIYSVILLLAPHIAPNEAFFDAMEALSVYCDQLSDGENIYLFSASLTKNAYIKKMCAAGARLF